jgi:DNA polymerase I
MLVQTDEQMEAAFTVLVSAPRIVVDTETFYIKPGVETKQLGTVTYCPIAGREMDISFYFPFRHQHDPDLFGSKNLSQNHMAKLKIALEREDVELIFHNAKFDLAVLKRDGINPVGKIWDTMLMSHLNDENEYHALKRLNKKLLKNESSDVREKQIKKLAKELGGGKINRGWHKVPPEAMALYAEEDVHLTHALWQHFLKELPKQELLELYDREEEFLRILMEIEENGVLVNLFKAKQLVTECEERREQIQSELGFDPMKPGPLAQKLFSPPPVGLGFVAQSFGKPSKTFPDGRPVMDKHALAHFDHPDVESILEYRGLVKAESTWFQGFIDAMWPDGRVHPDFRQHGTVTSRLSCANPNLQQLPRVEDEDQESQQIKYKVKSIISAPKGFQVWEFDYSQLEPRLATCYSQDPKLIAVYQDGRDIYQEIADSIGITRYQAKQLMLAIMYGAGKDKTAEMLGVQSSISEQIILAFWEEYPSLRATVSAAMQAAATRGWVRLWTGRRRHFWYPSEAHKAFNSILQGGGAEIVKDSGIRLKREMPELRIISQVHDSYWFELPEDKLDYYKKNIQRVMEWPGEEFHVPFPVEGKRIA